MKKGAMGRRTGVLNLRRPNMIIFAGNCEENVGLAQIFVLQGKERYCDVTIILIMCFWLADTFWRNFSEVAFARVSKFPALATYFVQ